MTTDRERSARRLSLGWQETADELCSNVWFGDAERVDRDGRDAFARTVAPVLGIDGRLSPTDLDGLHHAWTDPLARHDLLHAEGTDLGALVLPDSATGNGERFARVLAAGELDRARVELDRLVDRTGPQGPAAAHFARIFEERVLRDLSSGPVTKVDPDDGVRDRLVTVAARMAAAAPELFADAWSFVGDVIVFGEAEGATPGSMPDAFSQPGLSGVVFFSPDVLTLPWHAEVTLLHEAVHQKLYTLLLTRPLYDREGVDDEVTVTIPWRATSWPARRVISALHAYVHMTVALAALVEAALDEGRPLHPADGGEHDPLALLSVHAERMHHLAGEARQWDRGQLAEAGLDLVRWLCVVADDLGRRQAAAGDARFRAAPGR